MKALSRGARRLALLRAPFLQAGWNYDRMQNLGWSFCLEPALRELYPDPVVRAAALRRHLEIFNTHPYMAPYVMGAALRAEAEAACGAGAVQAVSDIKARLSPALAAVGDSFYWSSLRPAAAMLGIAWLWLAPQPWYLYAPLVFLAAYNLASLWPRLRGLERGWNLGENVAGHVAGLRLPAVAEGLGRMALVLAGAMAGCLARVIRPVAGRGVPLGDHFPLLGLGMLMLLALRLSVRPVVVLVFCVLGCLVLALALHPMNLP